MFYSIRWWRWCAKFPGIGSLQLQSDDHEAAAAVGLNGGILVKLSFNSDNYGIYCSPFSESGSNSHKAH